MYKEVPWLQTQIAWSAFPHIRLTIFIRIDL